MMGLILCWMEYLDGGFSWVGEDGFEHALWELCWLSGLSLADNFGSNCRCVGEANRNDIVRGSLLLDA